MDYAVIFKIVALIASGIGLYAARLIHRHKTTGAPLVCPLDSNCEAVVHSEYSKLFNIPLERIGSFYYVVVGVGFALEIIIPNLLPFIINQLVAGISIVAFCFSIYLTLLQLFKLKEWCAWCLVSALMCLIIFLCNVFLYGGALLSLSF